MSGCILAIDPSGAGTGIAQGLPGQIPVLTTQKFATDETDTPVIIFGRAVWWFEHRLASHPFDVLAIEQPLVVHNPMIICGLYAIFTGMARAHHVRVMPVTIAVWRKYFLGHGNLPGREAKRRAMRLCKALKWNPEGHDSAEAGGIWLWACGQTSPSVTQRHEPLFAGEPQ
jgi:hypothetical protein